MAGGQCLAVMLGVCQTREQAPPVVDQRHRAGEQPATMQILCREAAPAPLVLQFVEDVLAIGPVAIQLAQGQDFVLLRGILLVSDNGQSATKASNSPACFR